MIDVERLLPLAELRGQMDKFVASAEAAQPFPGEPAAYLPGKLATMLSDARSRLLLTVNSNMLTDSLARDWCLN